jgi:hypothetical protein
MEYKVGDVVFLIDNTHVAPRYKGPLTVVELRRNWWDIKQRGEWCYKLARYTKSGKVDSYGTVFRDDILRKGFGQKDLKEFF